MGRLLDIAKQTRPKAVDNCHNLPPTPVTPKLAPLQEVLGCPLHVRLESEWDNCDRAIHAVAHGEPLPAGLACFDVGTFINALRRADEWEATADIRKGFQTRKSEERDKSAGMRATKQLLRMPIAKPDANTCPGCFQPMGTPHRWDGADVCRGCHAKASASPDGFGITLSRAARWQRSEGRLSRRLLSHANNANL